MPHIKKIIQRNIDWVIVFACSYLLFKLILSRIATDIQIHAVSILEVNQGISPYPPNFLYYFLVNLVSGFSKNEQVILEAAVFILSAAVAAKYVLTRNVLAGFFEKSEAKRKEIILVAACCLLIFAIPDVYNLFYLKQIYISRIVPNVWHNSTIIALAPFAIMLFWKQYRILSGKEPSSLGNIFILFLLMLANVLIKPSFFFVFAPVTTVFLFLRYRFSAVFFMHLLPMIITAFVVYQLQQMIYVQNIASIYEEESTVALTAPFYVWSQVMPGWYIPVALVMSFMLPLSYFILFRKTVIIDRELLWYVLAMMLLGVLISAFVGEKGPRELHLNFFWQNVICCYLLNLVVIIDALKRYIVKKPGLEMSIFSLIFSAHVLAGIFYFVVMFYRQHYR